MHGGCCGSPDLPVRRVEGSTSLANKFIGGQRQSDKRLDNDGHFENTRNVKVSKVVNLVRPGDPRPQPHSQKNKNITNI